VFWRAHVSSCMIRAFQLETYVVHELWRTVGDASASYVLRLGQLNWRSMQTRHAMMCLQYESTTKIISLDSKLKVLYMQCIRCEPQICTTFFDVGVYGKFPSIEFSRDQCNQYHYDRPQHDSGYTYCMMAIVPFVAKQRSLSLLPGTLKPRSA
jgi:hypothetical protein